MFNYLKKPNLIHKKVEIKSLESPGVLINGTMAAALKTFITATTWQSLNVL